MFSIWVSQALTKTIPHHLFIIEYFLLISNISKPIPLFLFRHIESSLQNVLIKIRFRCIKKDHSLSIFLENERSFTFLLFCWMIKILLFLWCVSEAAVQYHRHVYSIRNCLFVCFSVTLIKPEKPLKVPKIKDFYKSARCSATIVSICVDRVIEMHFPEFSLYSGSEKCCNPL